MWTARAEAQQALEGNPISMFFNPGEAAYMAAQRNADTVVALKTAWGILSTIGGAAFLKKVATAARTAGLALPAIFATAQAVGE